MYERELKLMQKSGFHSPENKLKRRTVVVDFSV